MIRQADKMVDNLNNPCYTSVFKRLFKAHELINVL